MDELELLPLYTPVAIGSRSGQIVGHALVHDPYHHTPQMKYIVLLDPKSRFWAAIEDSGSDSLSVSTLVIDPSNVEEQHQRPLDLDSFD